VNRVKRSPWEEWGQVDPLWSIVTESGKEFGRWDIDEFFASGQATIESLWATASGLGLPRQLRRGLDFGCGVGRLTRALGRHVEEMVGLDISPTMIRLAKEHHADFKGLRFSIHEGSDLNGYGDGHFDVVCSLLVLQHLASQEAIVTYLHEFMRVLAPGGLLVLQLPEDVEPERVEPSLRMRIRPRTRIAGALHGMGVHPKVLYDRLGWQPEMTMRGMKKEAVRSLVGESGGRVAWSSESTDAPKSYDTFYLITR
jgi:SAM-dependent methyltransferase